MQQDRASETTIDRGTLVVLGIVAVVLIAMAILQQTPAGKRLSGQVQAVEQPAVVRAGAVGVAPAPKLTRAPTKKSGSNKMAAWTASGAGDASYNGTYVEDGTYGGQPAYTNGSRWLYYVPDSWMLGPVKEPSPNPSAAYSNGSSLPGTWGVIYDGTAPAPTLAAGPWIRFGTSSADAALWDDATKHRFSKYGDQGGGYRNVDTGVSGDCPASFGVEYEAPDIPSGYKIVVKCGGSNVWHTESEIAGGTGTLSETLACTLPWASGGSWSTILGAAGTQTLTVELRKVSDDTLVASDTAVWTMFIPALTIATPAENADVSSPVTLGLELSEWWAPADPEAEITQEGGGTVSGGTIVWELPTLTASGAIPLDASALIDGSEFTLVAEINVSVALLTDSVDLIYDEVYAIQIDTPQDGATLLNNCTTVTGQCTGGIKGWAVLYRNSNVAIPVSSVPAAAVWSTSLDYPPDDRVGGVQARQEWLGTDGYMHPLAESAWVWFNMPGNNDPTPPTPPVPDEPTVRIDLPALNATVGDAFTGLISYSGYSTGLGTLTVLLIGPSDTYELLSASRAVVSAGGQYVESLAMPEGLSEGEYTLLARLALGAETDDDSHLINYDAELVLSDPPTCEIVAPLDAASVSGAVNVDVDATDDAGIYAVGFYCDGMLQSTLSAPNYGALYRFSWDATVWANGSHVLEARAVDVDLQVASDSITVNLVNSMADTTLVRLTPPLGYGIEIGNWTDRDYTRAIEDLQVPTPVSSNPAQQYILQVGYNKPGTSRVWADYRIVTPGKSHGLVPATGNRIAWAICATPRQTAASWAAGGADAIRLAASETAVYALETTPHAVRAIGLVSGADAVFADLSSLASAPVDLAYWDGRVCVAHSDRVLLLPEDGSLGMEILMPWPDVVTSVDRLAIAGGELVMAATLAAGGTRLYRYDGTRIAAVCDHDYQVTAIALCGAVLMVGNANGDVLQLSGTALQLAYATGEDSVRALGINGSTIYAGTGDSGLIYSKVVGWGQSADMGWTKVRALASYNGWQYAGGDGTGGQYLWYESAPSTWVQAMELTGATAVHDLLAVSTAGAEQLFAAVSGAAAGATWRVEMATVDGIVAGREWIDHPTYEFGVLA